MVESRRGHPPAMGSNLCVHFTRPHVQEDLEGLTKATKTVRQLTIACPGIASLECKTKFPPQNFEHTHTDQVSDKTKKKSQSVEDLRNVENKQNDTTLSKRQKKRLREKRNDKLRHEAKAGKLCHHHPVAQDESDDEEWLQEAHRLAASSPSSASSSTGQSTSSENYSRCTGACCAGIDEHGCEV